MERLVDKINSKIKEEILDPSVFLVDTIISGETIAPVITIIIDGDNGVNIKKCVDLSRGLKDFLNNSDEMPENFSLTVSSPGLDHPLKLIRQYKKNVGRKIKVVLKEDESLEGVLSEVSKNDIKLLIIKSRKSEENETLTIPLKEIKKTMVMVSFKKSENG